MIRFKNVKKGLLAITFALLAGALSQLYINTRTFAANTLPGSNEIITIGGTTDGLPVNAPASAWGYSGDGNVILLSSTATNLPNAGTYEGLYTYNIRTNTTARVDISTGGTIPDYIYVGTPIISQTGRYVLFASAATNLIDGTTSAQRQIYKRDTVTNTTTVVASGYSGGLSQNQDKNLGISNDGRFVLVGSRYIGNGYPNFYGVAYGDSKTGSYAWSSLASTNGGADDASAGGISCDGSFAVVEAGTSLYLKDMRNVNSPTLTVIASNSSTSPIISCNGNYVLYATMNRTDISPTPSGMSSSMHLVRYDRITGERKYIDSNSSGVFSAGLAWNSPYDAKENLFNASIADTGDVVFKYGSNTYLKHLSDGSGTLESIGKTSSGTYVNIGAGKITSDGRYVFFGTDPYNLGLTPTPSSSQIIRAKTGL